MIMTEYQARSALRALREYKQEHLGLAELAQVAGVNKNTASNWRNRNRVPEADQKLASGPVWTKATVHAWLMGLAKDAAQQSAKL